VKIAIIVLTGVAFLSAPGLYLKEAGADSKPSPLSGLMLADKKEKKELEEKEELLRSKEELLKSKEELLKKWEESLKQKEEDLKAWESRLKRRSGQRRPAPTLPGTPAGQVSAPASGTTGSPAPPAGPTRTVPQTGQPINR
jgi:hypothetical protein